LEDGVEFLVKRLLREFDLSHVKIAYSADLEVFVDDLNVVHPSVRSMKNGQLLELAVGVFL
jgi:hypothetical protein